MKRKRVSLSVIIFLLCIAGIVALAFWPSGPGWPFTEKEQQERNRTRVIVPSVPDDAESEFAMDESIVYDEILNLKASLGTGEFAILVLNFDFNNDSIDEQIVVYQNHVDTGVPISVAFFSYHEENMAYRRIWNAAIEATVPGTIALHTQDLLGNRSACVIVTGMNAQSEHTMTIFRSNIDNQEQPFQTIADIRIDGPITVQETERPLAYRQGIARGQPFAITAMGRDSDSSNILDRIEITYTYSQTRGVYEQSRIIRVPGSQIEQRRLREILSGNPKVFENFINDLWYHVSPQGTIDRNQYIYFDPDKREIIFYGDEAQQVFNWQHSASTRYGIYITSQNISVTTLRRFLDIELESLDSVRMKIFEDVRLKIGLSTSWDGSYRRAGNILKSASGDKTIRPYIDAVYDSSMGRLIFYANGEYELSSSGTLTKGRYAFFRADQHELLELRPERNSSAAAGNANNNASSNANNSASSIIARNDNPENRLVYAIIGGTDIYTSENLSLSRVRMGTVGIQDLHEAQVVLTRAGR